MSFLQIILILRLTGYQGIFWAYIIFNFALVFIFSWLYLHGVRDFKRRLSEHKTRKGEDATA